MVHKKFPTFAVILLVFALFWLFGGRWLPVIKWVPVVILIIAGGMIINRYFRK